MNIEGFKKWIMKNEPKEASKVDSYAGGLQVIEMLLGKDMDDIVSGGNLESVAQKVKGMLGKDGGDSSMMDTVKGLGGLLGGAGNLLGGGDKSAGSLLGGLIGGSASNDSMLGGLADKAKGLLNGKVDIMFLLQLYQKFFKSK